MASTTTRHGKLAAVGRVRVTPKRQLDLILALAAAVVATPLAALVAIVVRVTMGSPVIFRQARVGQGEEVFYLVKFRTMRPPVPGQVAFGSDSERLTPVGRVLRRTSLDELPTLWNVIKGDMSIVGPRPLPVHYLPRYSEEQRRRHQVPPGITGWAQVNGRNALSWEEKFSLDLWYVDNQSLMLDLRIMVRTVLHLLRPTGISHESHVTMPEFLGSARRTGRETDP